MKTRKRMLSILLAVMLIIGIVPMTVFAQGPTSPAAAGDVVNIPDPNFQKLINSTLNRQEDTAITVGDMEGLTSLTINGTTDVEDIDGIQYAVNLRSLYMSGNIQNVNKIAGLTKLTRLTVSSNDFMTDIAQLGSKPVLEELDLDDCEKLTSLEGLTKENYPALQELYCARCKALSDISELSNQEILTLKTVDFGDSASIADITPLMGYSALEELDIEKVKITEENRNGYRNTIRSLTNLTTLYMPYCEITDEDTEMFSALTNLKTLVLNMNELTNTAFCDQLPEDIEVLGLHGNDIDNMENLGRLTNLTILGLGNNNVTDFSFIPELPSLNKGGIRHAEGEEDYPARETYFCGSQSNPIEIEDGQIVLDNPYIGADGKPVSFANATIASSDDSGVTVSYDTATNKITLGNIPTRTTVNSILVEVRYDLPVSNGEYKICELRVEAYVKEKAHYTISYDWGTDVPDGYTLPSDATEYQSLNAAKAAMDKTFTDQTTVKGEKDGKEGTWAFSGWTVTVTGNTVNAKGSWSFTENHQHNWGEPVYTWAEDGKTCTAVRTCAEDSSHVEKAEAEVTGKVTTPATCTAKGQTTYTATFESSWAGTQTKVVEDVEMLPHSYGATWEADETNHWHVCTECGAKTDEAAHNYEWIIDQEATNMQNGSKHQECSVCGYALDAVEILLIETPEDTEQPDPPKTTTSSQPEVPQTGDNGNPLFWILLCAVAGGLGAIFFVKRKQVNR